MCVSSTVINMNALKAIVKPTNGFFIGFKNIKSNGRPLWMGGLKYKPGLHTAKYHGQKLITKPTQKDYRKTHCGIHIYYDLEHARKDSISTSCGVIKVLCHINDVIVADISQAALTRVTILQDQWNEFSKPFATPADAKLLSSLGVS